MFHNEKQNMDVYAVEFGDTLIGHYEKHEYKSGEKMGMYELGKG